MTTPNIIEKAANEIENFIEQVNKNTESILINRILIICIFSVIAIAIIIKLFAKNRIATLEIQNYELQKRVERLENIIMLKNSDKNKEATSQKEKIDENFAQLNSEEKSKILDLVLRNRK